MSATTINRIDKQLDQLDPESLRARVLIALRQFRAGWVELGRLLTEVAYSGDYKEWGYEEFELYCARELGLKKPTVKKLMVSFNYMKTYEPNRLDQYDESNDGGQMPNIPDYQTVDLLHRARENDSIDESQKSRFHDMAFGGEGDEGELRKELRNSIRHGDSSEGMSDRKRELNDILRTARALRRKLAHATQIPEGIRDRIEQALVELEALD